MERSASAKLIYGVDFGSEEDHYADGYVQGLPPWLVNLLPDDDWEDPHWELSKLLKPARMEVLRYGYNSGASAVGVVLGAALDFGSERIDLDIAHSRLVGDFASLLKGWGAPDTVVPGYILLASYG